MLLLKPSPLASGGCQGLSVTAVIPVSGAGPASALVQLVLQLWLLASASAHASGVCHQRVAGKLSAVPLMTVRLSSCLCRFSTAAASAQLLLLVLRLLLVLLPVQLMLLVHFLLLAPSLLLGPCCLHKWWVLTLVCFCIPNSLNLQSLQAT